jgi:hypothetical protein
MIGFLERKSSLPSCLATIPARQGVRRGTGRSGHILVIALTASWSAVSSSGRAGAGAQFGVDSLPANIRRAIIGTIGCRAWFACVAFLLPVLS